MVLPGADAKSQSRRIARQPIVKKFVGHILNTGRAPFFYGVVNGRISTPFCEERAPVHTAGAY